MVIIVGFNVGGAWMGIEWCDWIFRWVYGGRGGKVTMCGSGGLCGWYGCRRTWCCSMLGFVASLLYILLSGCNQRGTLVWHGQSKGFVVLLLGVEGAWVQFVMQVQFRMW
jgi:hypothetical protein